MGGRQEAMGSNGRQWKGNWKQPQPMQAVMGLKLGTLGGTWEHSEEPTPLTTPQQKPPSLPSPYWESQPPVTGIRFIDVSSTPQIPDAKIPPRWGGEGAINKEGVKGTWGRGQELGRNSPYWKKPYVH